MEEKNLRKPQATVTNFTVCQFWESPKNLIGKKSPSLPLCIEIIRYAFLAIQIFSVIQLKCTDHCNRIQDSYILRSNVLCLILDYPLLTLSTGMEVEILEWAKVALRFICVSYSQNPS